MTRAGGSWPTTTTPTVSADPLAVRSLDADWRDQAACRDADPRLFDYDPETDPESTAEAAKGMCAGCPVSAACLSDALSLPPDDDCVGILGGLTPATVWPAQASGRRALPFRQAAVGRGRGSGVRARL